MFRSVSTAEAAGFRQQASVLQWAYSSGGHGAMQTSRGKKKPACLRSACQLERLRRLKDRRHKDLRDGFPQIECPQPETSLSAANARAPCNHGPVARHHEYGTNDASAEVGLERTGKLDTIEKE